MWTILDVNNGDDYSQGNVTLSNLLLSIYCVIGWFDQQSFIGLYKTLVYGDWQLQKRYNDLPPELMSKIIHFASAFKCFS